MGSRAALAIGGKDGKCGGEQGNGTAAQHDSYDSYVCMEHTQSPRKNWRGGS